MDDQSGHANTYSSETVDPMSSSRTTPLAIFLMRTGSEIREIAETAYELEPHFNVRPIDKPRTGRVPGTMEHYPFEP